MAAKKARKKTTKAKAPKITEADYLAARRSPQGRKIRRQRLIGMVGATAIGLVRPSAGVAALTALRSMEEVRTMKLAEKMKAKKLARKKKATKKAEKGRAG